MIKTDCDNILVSGKLYVAILSFSIFSNPNEEWANVIFSGEILIALDTKISKKFSKSLAVRFISGEHIDAFFIYTETFDVHRLLRAM